MVVCWSSTYALGLLALLVPFALIFMLAFVDVLRCSMTDVAVVVSDAVANRIGAGVGEPEDRQVGYTI